MRTNDDDVELETALQELVLNLLGDGVKTNVGVGTDLLSSGHGGDDGGGDDEERMEVDDNKALSGGNAQISAKDRDLLGSQYLLIHILNSDYHSYPTC